jgi:hypothetical protein
MFAQMGLVLLISAWSGWSRWGRWGRWGWWGLQVVLVMMVCSVVMGMVMGSMVVSNATIVPSLDTVVWFGRRH